MEKLLTWARKTNRHCLGRVKPHTRLTAAGDNMFIHSDHLWKPRLYLLTSVLFANGSECLPANLLDPWYLLGDGWALKWRHFKGDTFNLRMKAQFHFMQYVKDDSFLSMLLAVKKILLKYIIITIYYSIFLSSLR